MYKFLRDNRGFTISELIVSMVIAVLVFFIIVSIFSLNQSVARKTSIQGELLQNGRIVFDTLARELRQAQAIVTELPNDNTFPELLAHELEFEDGHVTNQIQYVRYYLDTTDLYREVKVYYFDSNPSVYVHWDDINSFGEPKSLTLETKQIAEHFSSLSFYGNEIISIEASLESSNETISLSTSITPRNI